MPLCWATADTDSAATAAAVRTALCMIVSFWTAVKTQPLPRCFRNCAERSAANGHRRNALSRDIRSSSQDGHPAFGRTWWRRISAGRYPGLRAPIIPELKDIGNALAVEDPPDLRRI